MEPPAPHQPAAGAGKPSGWPHDNFAISAAGYRRDVPGLRLPLKRAATGCVLSSPPRRSHSPFTIGARLPRATPATRASHPRRRQSGGPARDSGPRTLRACQRPPQGSSRGGITPCFIWCFRRCNGVPCCRLPDSAATVGSPRGDPERLTASRAPPAPPSLSHGRPDRDRSLIAKPIFIGRHC